MRMRCPSARFWRWLPMVLAPASVYVGIDAADLDTPRQMRRATLWVVSRFSTCEVLRPSSGSAYNGTDSTSPWCIWSIMLWGAPQVLPASDRKVLVRRLMLWIARATAGPQVSRRSMTSPRHV
uniref:Putative secreted protein n=1 Tax=Ixodes ricinus TaxID=34613 RepID=A0A6B0UNN1_IXORI